MIIYIGILFLVCAWIWLEDKSLNRRAIWVPALILITFATIRDYTIGTDTSTYTHAFRMGISSDYYIFDPEVELGYQSLVYLLLKFGFTEYYVLFLTTSLLVIIPRLYFLKKYSPNYILSIYMFITLSMYTSYFNTLRQGIAISFVIFSIKYLIEKKLIPFVLVIFIASLFHISALVMIPVYFIVHLKWNLALKLLSVFLASLFGSSLLINTLASDSRRYGGYAETAENAGGYLIFLFYLLLGIIVYLFGDKLRKENVEFNIFEQIYLIGIALVIPILMLGTNPAGPQRIFNYFSFFIIILLPYVFKRFNSKIITYLFCIGFLMLYILTTTSLYQIYPYVINPIFDFF